MRHLCGFLVWEFLQKEELRVLLTAQEQRAIFLLPGLVFCPHPENTMQQTTPCQKQGARKPTIFRGGKTVCGGVSSSTTVPTIMYGVSQGWGKGIIGFSRETDLDKLGGTELNKDRLEAFQNRNMKEH